MTYMLIPNKPQKGKNIDEILAGLPKPAEKKPKTGQGIVPVPNTGLKGLELWYFINDFWHGTLKMETCGYVHSGAPRYIEERINAKSRNSRVWEKGCVTGELTVLSSDCVLVLPTKISRNYAKEATLQNWLGTVLVLPPDEYAKLRDASTDDVKKAIEGDLPFLIPREKFCQDVRVEELHESPLAVRVCGGIEQAKKYAVRLKEFGVDSIKQYFAKRIAHEHSVCGLALGHIKDCCIATDYVDLEDQTNILRGARWREKKSQSGGSSQ